MQKLLKWTDCGKAQALLRQIDRQIFFYLFADDRKGLKVVTFLAVNFCFGDLGMTENNNIKVKDQ